MPERWPVSVVVLLAGSIQLFGQNSNQDQSPKSTPPAAIGYQSAPDADKNKTLLLRDQPASTLHAAEHPVSKAKFFAIDAHNHVHDAAGINEPMPPEHGVEVMSILTNGDIQGRTAGKSMEWNYRTWSWRKFII
jgi:hypothetical protein